MTAEATVTIKFDGEEYRVPHPEGTEAAAYYTDDKQDALDTFTVMWRGVNVTPRIHIHRATWDA